jgi:hypothetical protein
VLPFALEFLVLAPLVLGADIPEMAPLYLFLFPMLLFVLGLLNLPFLAAAFRLFRLDVRTRRNHALEHATIHFLMTQGVKGVAGEATLHGFRVSGGASPAEVRAAFDRVRELLRRQQPLPHVSRYCGSNRVTALALGLLLLLLVGTVSLAVRPALWIRALALCSVALVFMSMRHTVGNWVQARFFMATDFAEAQIRSVEKLKASDVERPPVYFVETVVLLREPVVASGRA